MDNLQSGTGREGGIINTKIEKRPRMLTALLIFCLVIGGGGFFVSLGFIPQQFLTRAEAMDAADPSKTMMGKLQTNITEELIQVQRDMAGDLYDKTLSLRPLGLVVAISNIFLCAGLAIFAIFVFRRKDFGRKGLIVVSAIHLPFEILRFILLYKISMVTSASMSHWIGKIHEAQGLSEVSDKMPNLGAITSTVMLVQYVAMAVVFIAIYSFVIIYLRRPTSQNWCDE